MAINTGFPIQNYGVELRNLEDVAFGSNRIALGIPRPKYQFLIEFAINPTVWQNNLTNIKQYLDNGKFYVHVKAVDHPKYTFKHERVRVYNKEQVLYTKMDYQPLVLVFHDDTTSLVMALWKEYLNFFHETGDLGQDLAADATSGFLRVNERVSKSGIGFERFGDNLRGSGGMKLVTTLSRSFFDNIIVYDYGVDPDSMNVYYYYHPFIVQFDHESLDYEDRIGKSAITMTFEYEASYFTVGQSSTLTEHALAGVNPGYQGSTVQSRGHSLMVQQRMDTGASGTSSGGGGGGGSGYDTSQTSGIGPIRDNWGTTALSQPNQVDQQTTAAPDDQQRQAGETTDDFAQRSGAATDASQLSANSATLSASDRAQAGAEGDLGTGNDVSYAAPNQPAGASDNAGTLSAADRAQAAAEGGYTGAARTAQSQPDPNAQDSGLPPSGTAREAQQQVNTASPPPPSPPPSDPDQAARATERQNQLDEAEHNLAEAQTNLQRVTNASANVPPEYVQEFQRMATEAQYDLDRVRSNQRGILGNTNNATSRAANNSRLAGLI